MAKKRLETRLVELSDREMGYLILGHPIPRDDMLEPYWGGLVYESASGARSWRAELVMGLGVQEKLSFLDWLRGIRREPPVRGT